MDGGSRAMPRTRSPTVKLNNYSRWRSTPSSPLSDDVLTAELQFARGRVRDALGHYSAAADDLRDAEQLAGAIGAADIEATALTRTRLGRVPRTRHLLGRGARRARRCVSRCWRRACRSSSGASETLGATSTDP